MDYVINIYSLYHWKYVGCVKVDQSFIAYFDYLYAYLFGKRGV